MLKLNKGTKIGIRFLFMRKLDVAAQAQSTYLLGTTIRRFHDTGFTASHDRVAGAS
jgi:hypothetical protein